MKITRRDFIKWATAFSVALGFSELEMNNLRNALAANDAPPVIWLQGSSCSGCSVAALNIVSPTTIDDVLINKISLKYHPTLMAAGSEAAIAAMDNTAQINNGNYILVIEGGISTQNSGRYCIIGERNGVPVTMLEAVNNLATKAKYVLAIGTCAAYKGVPGSGSNITGIQSTKDILYKKTVNPVINLPGCPVAPEILFGVIISLITGSNVSLDRENRPIKYYSSKIHGICPRRGTSKAKALGDAGCLLNLGCKGPNTYETCPNHMWNNGKNWCIGAGHHCIGCAMMSFPEAPMLKFGTYV